MNVGDEVGNYRITEVLGEGGMGVVYLGMHKLIGREAAIKVLLPSLSNKQEVVQRFFNEAKTTTSINHPGIVEVFDFGYSDSGHAYIIMERLEGETLDHRIRRLGRLSADRAIGLFGQITRALGAAHGLGVVHRDLKPANIYIVSDPDVSGGERAKILDFGIAKLRNVGNAGVRTASGQLMGAPDYMAPEQCLGASEVDQRGDLYALGCMLFHAVTGKTPFPGANFSEVLAAHVSKEAPRASTMAPVPEPLDDLIHQLMKKSPDDRPQNTGEVDVLLKRALGAKPTGPVTNPPGRAPALSSPPPLPASVRRTMIAPSQPPPLPASVVDSSAALPPLPRPKASQPPPIPRAAASARTLYTDPNPEPPAAPRSAMPGNPVLSVPGPVPDRHSAPGLSASGVSASGVSASGVSAQGVAGPHQPTVQAGPRRTMALPPGASPAYSTVQPDPGRPGHGPEPAVEMGPRQGNNVRPTYATHGRGSPWKMILIGVFVIGFSAGGFFLYKSMTRKGSVAADSIASDASAVSSSDAVVTAAIQPRVDAGVAVATKAADAGPVVVVDASVTVALDASVARIPDAAVMVAETPDASVFAARKPDAAPKPPLDTGPVVRPSTVSSGRIVDPDLKSATGGDDGIETVVLKIETRPAGAIVTRAHDKLRIGKTPLEFVTRKFNANETFELSLNGHYPVSVKISTVRDSKRLVQLLAKPN